jgi:hypothetical protein
MSLNPAAWEVEARELKNYKHANFEACPGKVKAGDMAQVVEWLGKP